MPPRRQALEKARRVVVKIGTNALTGLTGRFLRPHFARLAADLAWAAKDRQLLVVSSGAIALGVERLGLSARPPDIPGKQACAAVGQSRLMRAYEEALGRRGLLVAQVLLTHQDVADRRRYLNARHTLERLLDQGVIPVINENDTVSVDEIKFGDNDTLAALVAGLVGADLLVILTDVDGLFEEDPRRNAQARLLTRVTEVDAALLALAQGAPGAVGTGGMQSKVKAAALVTELGIPCVVTSGSARGRLRQVLGGAEVGTWFEPRRTRPARHAWIAHALRPKGRLWLDAGAVRAVRDGKKSLLPSGLREVEGEFDQGSPVELVGPEGQVFAKGLAAYSAADLRRIAGKKSSQIEPILGYRYLDEAVHRDDLVVL